MKIRRVQLRLHVQRATNLRRRWGGNVLVLVSFFATDRGGTVANLPRALANLPRDLPGVLAKHTIFDSHYVCTLDRRKLPRLFFSTSHFQESIFLLNDEHMLKTKTSFQYYSLP